MLPAAFNRGGGSLEQTHNHSFGPRYGLGSVRACVRVDATSRQFPLTLPADPLELAAHFIVALYATTRGRSGRFRRIADCAERAGIKKASEIKTAVSTAEKAGFLVVHVDEPAVMLTAKGLEVAAKRG